MSNLNQLSSPQPPATDIGWQAALAVVMEHEGGFVDDPNDPGGATKYGVSLRELRRLGDLDFDLDGDGDVDADDIRALTPDAAAAFYRKHFWDRHGYGRFPDLFVATKVFDLAVNMGPGQAHKCLQRACRAAGSPLIDDGILGPKTHAAVAALHFKGLLPAIRSEAAGFYRGLVIAKPVRGKYLAGWLNRAYS